MASGTGSQDPPRLPPPEFRKESKEDFMKRPQPPLRGIMVDPEYPPTAEEASKAFKASFEKPESHLKRSSGASKIFNQAPTSKEIINTIPGGDKLQPGGGKYSDPAAEAVPAEPPAATLGNALKTVSLRDFVAFHQIPCVRPALLNGMIAGFALGGLTLITGRTLWKASTYTVWGFVGTGAVSYPYCKMQMKRERDGMRQAVKIMEEKEEKKKRQIEERRRKAAEAREAREREEEERRKRERPWYRFW